MLDLEKIQLLFEYRKLPQLLKFVSEEKREELRKQLIQLQALIYELDTYLENHWQISDKQLERYWTAIRQQLIYIGYKEEELEDLCVEIRRYQHHELQLRKNKLPLELDLEYFYYFKSCDVKLIRNIIYKHSRGLEERFPINDWRLFDLVTEINDDVDDLYEDLETINGNAFLISLVENGKESCLATFSGLLDKIEIENTQNLENSDYHADSEIWKLTQEQIELTRILMLKQLDKWTLNLDKLDRGLYKYLLRA